MRGRTRRLGVVAAVVVLALGWLAYTPDLPTAALERRYADGASRFVQVGTQRVHVRDEGAGPAIVLIHGTGASLHTWDAWAVALRDSFRVVRFDLPGFGLTGPSATGDYSIEALTAFVGAALDALQVPSAILVGNSLGGEVAWQFALRAPARVRGLVLVDPAGLPIDAPPPMAMRIARTPVVNALVRVVSPRALVRKSLLDVYANDALVSDTLVDRYWALLRRPGARDAFVRRVQGQRYAADAPLERLAVPTLVVWGAADTWIPAALATEFVRRIPGASLAMIPDAGHVPHEEAPAATLAPVLRFISMLPRAVDVSP
ncbi:MAG: alpha/beta fold hydrolase [Gemmatimonadaceae bacterium]|nr:alpha/beta fold hydrolase [Gemmatimonadaceae bacterium]